ncbi:MAG: PH domain-containing protein [Actinomycetota bacterium]|nr:PH domain-containing protein [Actinomycetota bacterium]
MTNSRYLASDERAVLEVRRHPIVVLGSMALATAAVAAAGTIGWITSPSEGAAWVDTALGVVALAFAARAGWRFWQWWVDRIIVTDQRIFEVSGVLTRKVASMPLTRVTDMTYRRSIGGRLLGYGDLIVESAGQDQALSHIMRIPKPDDFYRTITSLVTAGLPSLIPDDGTFSLDEEDTGPLPQVIV